MIFIAIPKWLPSKVQRFIWRRLSFRAKIIQTFMALEAPKAQDFAEDGGFRKLWSTDLIEHDGCGFVIANEIQHYKKINNNMFRWWPYWGHTKVQFK